MSVRTTVATQLERFDDDAWVALANRGLLRRATKDLASLTPEVVGDDDTLRVQVGPHLVTFDERGPGSATCSCPSGTICQHIIAAGLWLAPRSGDTMPGAPGSDKPGDLHADLMGLDTDLLVKHAGKAAYRWAFQYVDDLDLESDVRVESGRQVVIGLTSPRVTFRYVGGGMAGLMADTRLPHPEKYVVAAVLAYQRAHGVEHAPPEAPRSRVSEGSTDLVDQRRRLREAAARLLTDTVRLGVAHLSPSMHQRYETLAVWAQGAAYHRLALLLRRLADHVELMLDRSARADEHLLLDEAAITHALVAALDASESSGGAATRLVGQARQRYDTVRTMELVGLGSAPWRSASGYRGLTTLFWWPEESRFVSLTDARPESMPGFDPRVRHAAPGPWTGLSSPAAAAGAGVRLTDAQLGGTGRISSVERTHASVVPRDGADIAGALRVVTTWSELAAGLREGLSLLDPPDPLRAWAVIRPTAFEPARFDPISQTSTWVVHDDSGDILPLVLAYTTENAQAIERVESLTAEELGDGTLVVCRCRLTPGGLVGEPLSVIHPGLRADARPVDALHFPPPGWRAPARRRPTPAAEPSARISNLPAQLLDLRAWLVSQAERGTGAASATSIGASLAARHQALRGIGFDVFPATSPEDDPASALLRSHFLVMQTTQLLKGEPA